ncbi:MAG: M48 family metallopeptidase [Candidatus Pacearchaeota archaeon]
MINLSEKERITFYKQISSNKRRSVFLVLIVALVLIGLVYIIGLAIGGDIFFISVFAIVFSLTYILISYHNSAKIALWSVGAKPADPYHYKQYHDLVEGLCLASGMPKPKLYIMESEQINAFASGKNPKDSVICVTTGALKKLDKRELEGVLAHELSHIANYDIRFMTLTAVLVGLVSIIAEVFLRSLFWGRLIGGRNRNNRGNPALVLIAIILAVLSPIIVSLVQLAISRKREYMADATAVKFIRSPTGLIGALKKIKNDGQEMRVPKAVAPLFLAKPFKTAEIFSTHPPLEKRIEILERM